MSTTPSDGRPSTTYRKRLTGEKRETTAKALAAEYEAGSSIRSVAAGAGLSYGTARLILIRAGVKLRGRGGSRAGRTAVGR